MIIPGKILTIKYQGEYLDFRPVPEQGAFYQITGADYEGRFGKIGRVGSLMIPMFADGTPDLANLSEVEVEYDQA